MKDNTYIYIAVMAAASYIVRVLPLTLIQKPIQNRFIQSFLYYVPYVTLSLMVFPAILTVPQAPVAGAAALLVGILMAWKSGNLFQVAVCCCVTVYVIERLVL